MIPEGYRLLTKDDVGKTFGVDLESKIYIDSSVTPNTFTDANDYIPLVTFENTSLEIFINDPLDQERNVGIFAFSTYNGERPTDGYPLYSDSSGVWTSSNVDLVNNLELTYTIKEVYFGGTFSGSNIEVEENTWLYVKDIEVADPYSIKIKNKEGIKLLTKDKTIEFDDDVEITIDESLLGGGESCGDSVDNGMIYEGKYRVRYFDVDGAILKIEYVAEGGKLTPPSNPSYDPDYLIFDEWNYDTANYIVERPTDIGATYKTVDDLTYLSFRVTLTAGLNINLYISGFESIDWGDGTINTSSSHTYAEEGEYMIKIAGNIAITTSSSSTYLLGGQYTTGGLKKIYLSKLLQSFPAYSLLSAGPAVVSLPKGITEISTSSFRYSKCRHINIPNGVTRLRNQSFSYTYVLRTISIPDSINTIDSATFTYAYCLESIMLPNNITSLEANVLSYCSVLYEIHVPKNLVEIGSNILSTNWALHEFVIPKNVQTITKNALYSTAGIKNLFIEANSVIELSGEISTANLSRMMIMWVNDDIIEELKVATNWSTYATRMKPLSWYPSLTNPNPPAGYTLTLNCTSDVLNSDTYMYSIDGGTIYNQFTSEVMTLENVTQIKFKTTASSHTYMKVGTTLRGGEITDGLQSSETENITLSSDTTYYIAMYTQVGGAD